MSRLRSVSRRVHSAGSLARVPYRPLQFQPLEARLALSAGTPAPATPDLYPVFAAAFVGTPVTISLPVQLTAGEYQITQGPQHGTATVNNQGQLVYNASDGDGWDDVEILTNSLDSSGNPIEVDVQIQNVPALPSSTAPVGWSTATTLQSDGTYQAQISSLYQAVASSVVSPVFQSASSYPAQISTDTLASGPQHGTITEVSPLNWVYTPNAGFTGVDQVTINVHAASPNAAPGDQNPQFFDGEVVIFIDVDTANAAPSNPAPANPAAAIPAAEPAADASPNAAVADAVVPAVAAAAVPAVAAPAVANAAVPAAAASPTLLVDQVSQSTPIASAAPAATPASSLPAQTSAAANAIVLAAPMAPLSVSAVDAVFAASLGPSQAANIQAASPVQPASPLDTATSELLGLL